MHVLALVMGSMTLSFLNPAHKIVLFCPLIGASLSELHTSVTALRTCVCMSACLLACLLVAIYRKFKLNERMLKFAHVLKQIHVQ